MSIEIEVKFRVADRNDLIERVVAIGAERISEIVQTDTYYSHPARDFAVTDEALRLRTGGGQTDLTFKGPKRGGPTKTREEIEVVLAGTPGSEEQMTRLLSRLGFRPLITIAKSRVLFQVTMNGKRMQVAVDEVQSLGSFAEVETIAQTDAEVPDAQRVVLDLSRALRLTDVEPRSYLRMALERHDRGPAVTVTRPNSAGTT